MPVAVATSYRRRATLAATMVAAPILPFFAILFYFAINVPVLDDYDAALSYLNRMSQTQGLWAKILWCLTWQHNEYKTVFCNAIVWFQIAIFDHIDFRLTCFLGNLFVPLIGFVLWKMFLPKETDSVRRCLLFMPVTLILFQLNYVQTLNWATTALVHLPALAFAFAAIYFLMKDTARAYCAALVMMVLSASASTNGFFVVPVGMWILFDRERFARLGGWLVTAGGSLGVYLFRYTILPSLHPEHHFFFVTFFYLRILYFLGFIGSAAFFPKQASFVFGLIILLYLVYLTKRGYWRRNPTAAYCVVFLLLTAAAVAGLRSQNGLYTAISSRYRIYSDLLLIFAWFSFVEEFLQYQAGSLRQNPYFRTALAASLVFCLSMDAGGIYSLHKRDRLLIEGMALYEHPQPTQPAGPVLPMPDQTPDYDRFDLHARAVMDEAVKTGAYHLPRY